MFDKIAPSYDLLNRILSMGIDRGWRKAAIRELSGLSPKHILDLATGTGDLAIEALTIQPQQVTGIDVSAGMLAFGKEKLKKLKLDKKVNFEIGDAENLRFESNFFDAATVSFGVRNFTNLLQGLTEINRVLKPGGKLVVLEFSKPKNNLLGILFKFYFSTILPAVGNLISGHKKAYTYLYESVQSFPDGQDFLAVMEKSGFKYTSLRPLSFGIATLYSGIK